jgi:hypothetical protein
MEVETDAERLEKDNVMSLQANGYKAFIVQDEDGSNPFENDDGNIGWIAHWSNRYNLGGFDPQRNDPEEWVEEAKRLRYIYLPVAMLDHSNVHIYEGSAAHPFDPGGWDSGQVGWVYTTPERVRDLYGVKSLNGPIRKRVIEELRAMISLLNHWVNNECYGYVITNADGDEVDSLWGIWPDYVPAGAPYVPNAEFAYIKSEALSSMNYMEPSTPKPPGL